MEVKSLVIVASFFILSCSHDQCSNVPQRPVAATPVASPAPEQPPAQLQAPKNAVKADSIQVFKATGEKQCEAAKGTPLEDMQNSLVEKKIQVSEAHTQPDGLMHMSLCGSPSGTIHVFTISKKDLKKALKLGFKVLKPN